MQKLKLSKNALWRLCHTYVNKDTGNLYLSGAHLDRSRYNGDGTRKGPEVLHYDLIRDNKVQVTAHKPENSDAKV